MTSNKKGLGRGFASLIPTDLLDESFDPTAKQDEKLSQLRELPIELVTPDPDQPRRSFEQKALEDLSASIVQHGILQPIVVVERDGTYLIVAGERRYRAAKLAGLSTIPAIIRSLSDQNKLELSLIENLQRKDLNAIETATAYLKLRDQFNLTLEEIGVRVGNRSTSAVSNTLRLLRLPKIAQIAIAEGKLTEGQARPLIGEEEAFVASVLPRIIEEEWSARKVEQFMVNAKADRKRQPQIAADAADSERTDRLKARLGTEIAIRTNSRGAGQIIIRFKNQQEFERIESLLEGSSQN